MKTTHHSAMLLGASLVAASILLSASGCLAVAAGAGAGAAVAYVRGDLEAPLDAGFERAVVAANRAVQELQFAKVSEHKDALLDLILARNAADKKIEIRIESESDRRTKLKIRVGLFGDEALSMVILDRIKSGL